MFLFTMKESSRHALRSSVLLALFYVSSCLNSTSNNGGHHTDDDNLAVILPVVFGILVLIVIGIVVWKKYVSRLDVSRTTNINVSRLDVSRTTNIKEVDMLEDSFLGLLSAVEDTGSYAKSDDMPDNTSLNAITIETTSGHEEKNVEFPTYKLRDNFPRGLVVVIGIDKFSKLKNLAAVRKDKDMVSNLFRDLQFEIRECSGTKKEQIVEFLKNISEENDHTRYDSFVCYISSHGKEKHVSCYDANPSTKQGYIEIKSIVGLFLNDTCTVFANKPKLFFFDICLGKGTHEAGTVSKDGYSRKSFKSKKEKTEAYKHILTFYSTIEGYVSWADSDGSRFTKALTTVINASNSGHSIYDLVNATHNRMVNNGNIDYKQTPTFSNKLVKALYLKKKE